MKNKNKVQLLILGQGEGRDENGVINKHVLTCTTAFDNTRTDDSITFMLNKLGVLSHNEHAKTVFDKGKISSYNQVEFNPYDETVARVFD